MPSLAHPFHLPEHYASAADWLSTRLRQVQAPPLGDVGLEAKTPAAVLVPLLKRPQGMTLLLTRRDDRLSKHPGQISFPGGRLDPGENEEEGALREAWEEVGLPQQQAQLVGRISDYATITGFRVTPVVALIDPDFPLQLAAGEVAEAFEVPLSFVLDIQNYQRHAFNLPGRSGHYLSLTWRQHFIWGATAGMLLTLYRTLVDEPAEPAAAEKATGAA